MKALLALEDGRTFSGRTFTAPQEAGESWGEVVFNTSMTGYQEVLTDPSYSGQMVTMTYPLVGNYGVNPEDVESGQIQVSAFLIREYQAFPSNFRSTSTLGSYLTAQDSMGQGVLGIEQLDTRALTKHIRKAGAMRAFLSTNDLDTASCVKKAKAISGMKGLDLVSNITTDEPYLWRNGKPLYIGKNTILDKDIWKHRGEKLLVAVFDFGIKYSILRCMEQEGFEVVVVPASTGADVIKAMEPDGIFFSNGPGDPEPVKYAISTIENLIGYRPMFGICLGHQLMGLALGGKTFKLKFGHRGSNQPVKNLLTNKIEITSQNHGFAVDVDSLKNKNVDITHVNLNDNTLEGFRHREYPMFAVQYHPEASPGPHDAKYLFCEFKKLIQES